MSRNANKKRFISDEQAEDLIQSLNFDDFYGNTENPDSNTAANDPVGFAHGQSDIPSDTAEPKPVAHSDIRPDRSPAGSAHAKKSSGVMGSFAKSVLLILWVVLFSWVLPSGNVMNLQSASLMSKDRNSYYQISSGNLLRDALSDIHNIPRQYILDMTDILTPEPDSEKFTKIEDDVRKNYNEKPIDYYKDDTIEVKCWKEKRLGVVFNFAEIWIVHPSQLRRTLVDNVISNKHLDFPSNIFKRTNGVVGMSADYAAFRDVGIIMQYGQVVRGNTRSFLEDAVYDKNGNFYGFTDSKDFFETDMYKNGDVIHTFSFGPILIDDYKVSESDKIDHYICQCSKIYPRACICQFDYDKHYLLCVIEMPGLTLREFANEIQSMGVRFAYNLDGGQTGTMLYNKQAFNKPAYGGQREVSDILYFATAVPNE